MRRATGFTLVELMVALFAMALLAVLSWRGLDGMVRARDITQARANEVLTLQIGFAQWSADLDAFAQLPNTKTIDWNGRVLRLLRRGSASASEGLHVVAWARRVADGRTMWSRWESPAITARGDLENAWQQADFWSQRQQQAADTRQVDIAPLDDWQIFFFRENAWTNPQSSDITSGIGAPLTPPGVPAAAGAIGGAMPDGVRAILTFPAGQAISGTVTRDWARTTLSTGKTS